jgi:hypothetical protein
VADHVQGFHLVVRQHLAAFDQRLPDDALQVLRQGRVAGKVP